MDQLPARPPDAFGYPSPGFGEAGSGAQPGPNYPPYPGAPYGGYPPNPYAPPPMPKNTGVPWWGWLLGGCLGLLVLGIAASCVLSVLLGARLGAIISSVSNLKYVTDTSTQSFTVSGTPSFVIDNTVGNVTYDGGPGNTVTVLITKRAGDSSVAAAQSDLQTISVTATQSGNTVTIQPTFATTQGLGRTQSVDIVIRGPATADFAITGSATPQFDFSGGNGRISLTNVAGVVNTNLNEGDIRLTNVTLADGSQLQTNLGSITSAGQLAPGASVTVTANVGSVDMSLPASTSTHLDATTDTGSISIVGWSVQPSSQGASSTAIGDLGTSPAGTLTIRVSTGSITLIAD